MSFSIATGLLDSVGPAYSLVFSFLLTVVYLCAGFALGKFFEKRTTFRGRITDFGLLYPIVPNGIMSWIVYPISVRAEDIRGFSAWFVADILLSLLLLAVDLVFLAFFLKAAAEADTEKGRKTMTVLLFVCLGSNILYQAMRVLFGGMSDATGYGWSRFAVQFVCYALICYGAAFGIYRKSKYNQIWLTALPLVYYIVPDILSVCEAIVYDL